MLTENIPHSYCYYYVHYYHLKMDSFVTLPISARNVDNYFERTKVVFRYYLSFSNQVSQHDSISHSLHDVCNHNSVIDRLEIEYSSRSYVESVINRVLASRYTMASQARLTN